MIRAMNIYLVDTSDDYGTVASWVVVAESKESALKLIRPEAIAKFHVDVTLLGAAAPAWSNPIVVLDNEM